MEQNYVAQRSMIEHHLLPDQLFDNTKNFIAAMATKGQEILFSIYDSAMPGKFQKDQFSVKAAPNKRGGLSVLLRLPDPDTVLACPFIGFSCAKDGTSPEYYTIERTVDGGFLLCTKPDKGSHAVLAEDCGSTPKEHATVLINRLKIGV